MTWLERGIVAFGFCVMFTLFALAICWMTVFPMMENYRECGTIFLCANQRK